MGKIYTILIFLTFFCIISLLISLNTSACEALDEECLDWRKRPQSIQTYIKDKHIGNRHSFSPPLQEDSLSTNAHIFCQMDPLLVVKSIILEAPKMQTTFFFLNLDVEDFSTNWTRRAIDVLKTQKDLPTDIVVYFISTCARFCSSKTNNRDGIFYLYEFDHFPLEYVRDALQRQGLFLDNEIDAVFTKKRLVKAVDPVGTCAQLYNLLRPKTGLLFGDEFYFNIEGNSSMDGDEIFPYHMSLFRDLGAPFILKRSLDPDTSCLDFVLCRKDEKPCRLPMSYHDLERISPNPNLTSAAVSVFKYTLNWNSHPLSDDNLARIFYHGLERKYWVFGNKNLYRWFQEQRLFLQNRSGPLKFWDPNSCI